MTKTKKKSKKKENTTCKSYFESSILLYTILGLVMINMFGFFHNNDDQSVFLFIIISALVYSITNNMIIVLGTAIIIVNFLIFCRYCFKEKYKEGMKNNDSVDSMELVKIHEKVMEFIENNGENYFDVEVTFDNSNTIHIGDLFIDISSEEIYDESGDFKESYDIQYISNLLDLISYVREKDENDIQDLEEDLREAVLYIVELDDFINSDPDDADEPDFN